MLERRFPGVRFRLIRGDRLSSHDGEFDLAVSFAVLEHVGSGALQRRFVAELARVARALLPSSGSGGARLLWTGGWPSNIELSWRAGARYGRAMAAGVEDGFRGR